MTYIFLWLPIVLGFFTGNILDLFGVYNGVKGLQYYGEAHLSKWNSLIHTIGMPFVYYGISLWVPALLFYDRWNAYKIQTFFYLLYMTHYMTINVWRGLFTAIVYLVPYYLSMVHYFESDSILYTFGYGFIISFIFLVFQEIFGHWIGDDIWSRWEAIPNAIIYAVFYSIYHINPPLQLHNVPQDAQF